ncbi:MAG: VanW family protein [Syntrophothermus sp.]
MLKKMSLKSGGRVILWVLVFSLVLAGCGSKKTPNVTFDRVEEGVTVEGVRLAGLTQKQTHERLSRIAESKRRPALSARFDERTWEIIPGKPGFTPNVAATLRRVMAAKPGEKVRLAANRVEPGVTEEELQSRIRTIGRYTTTIKEDKPDRLENIRITVRDLNYTIVRPGEIFSFNQVVGMPTRAKGYKPGVVFEDDGTTKIELGGGMCQVSSTLYNAVLEARFPVVERHRHSKPVSYVPPGRDATVYDDKDFRFRNNRANPVMIRGRVADGQVSIVILERRP